MKILPNNLEAEQNLLGEALIDKKSFIKARLTNNKRFVNIIFDIKGVVFLCLVIGFLVGAKSVTASLVSTERSPFFIGVDMRICSVKGCKEKHYGKGLCQKHYYKQWQEKNKEHKTKYNKQWEKDNPKYMKQYYQDNKKEIIKQAKQYYQENREKIAEYYKQYSKQYAQDNKERIAKRQKKWWRTPVGKACSKVSFHNRRTLLKGLTKEIVQKVYEANIKRFGILTCYLCFKPIIENDERLKSSLDHSTPITRKGSNKYDNLGIAHKSCNSKKHTMTLEEWKENNV